MISSSGEPGWALGAPGFVHAVPGGMPAGAVITRARVMTAPGGARTCRVDMLAQVEDSSRYFYTFVNPG